MASGYDAVYRRSIADPEGFWGEAAERLHWYRKWHTVLEAAAAFDEMRRLVD